MANNVRHLVLVLTSFCISLLFANLILFNLTAILDHDLPTELRPVPALDSLHEYTIWHGRSAFSSGSRNASNVISSAAFRSGEAVI